MFRVAGEGLERGGDMRSSSDWNGAPPGVGGTRSTTRRARMTISRTPSPVLV
jgi:hypothetical protein